MFAMPAGGAIGIERTEYHARQRAALGLARERGVSAVVAWSRGGSTQDHYADVYYLAGFYTHQPFIPDEPGRWRAHGHTALVLPVDGPGTLLVDMTEVQDPKPAADRVRVTEDLVESLATTVMATVPRHGRCASRRRGARMAVGPRAQYPPPRAPVPRSRRSRLGDAPHQERGGVRPAA